MNVRNMISQRQVNYKQPLMVTGEKVVVLDTDMTSHPLEPCHHFTSELTVAVTFAAT